ncbi:MAG: glycosyltransferase family 4 protein [Imperialibacter sp.]|uniref:glycosyltransferase family 4 protein n=1 Tax=Imperialibacter sp. TaxID=2038411 RepID=UPI0032F05B2A
MAPLRIGMLLDQDFPPDSRVENEAVSLIEAGFEVFLFSLAYKKGAGQEVWNGIKVKRYAANKWIYKSSAVAYDFPFFHKKVKSMIADFISKNDIQALHVHDMVLARAAFRANKVFGLPLTLDLHENRPVIMQFYPHLKKFPGKYLINLSRWEKAQNQLLREADRVVLVTEEARDEAVRSAGIDPGKVVVVPNTIHPDIFLSYPIEEQIVDRFKDTFNIVYVGDTGLRRGTMELIEALPIVLETVKNARLILVGKSSEDLQLMQRAEELGISRHVSFEGWQDVSLFPSYISVASVCVSPIHRNLHHDTTFANKIFQYMAMGKPLVVSDCPPQVRVVQEAQCGLVHEGGSAADLARQIIGISEDPSQAARMGENGKKAVLDKYNWPKTSARLIDYYQSLANE